MKEFSRNICQLSAVPAEILHMHTHVLIFVCRLIVVLTFLHIKRVHYNNYKLTTVLQLYTGNQFPCKVTYVKLDDTIIIVYYYYIIVCIVVFSGVIKIKTNTKVIA